MSSVNDFSSVKELITSYFQAGTAEDKKNIESVTNKVKAFVTQTFKENDGKKAFKFSVSATEFSTLGKKTTVEAVKVAVKELYPECECTAEYNGEFNKLADDEITPACSFVIKKEKKGD